MTVKALRDSTIAIVGLGLMGGSLALALRAHNACRALVAIGRNAATREQALARGVVDEASVSLQLAATADAIVLAAPVRANIGLLPRVGAIARKGAIVLDLGSTKREIVRAMDALPAHVQPIGAHPMCGKESSGFAAADADLYRGAVFVLTPLARTTPETLAWAQALAETMGARPLVLDAERHDRIVAAISHLPFAVASALMTAAIELKRDDDLVWMLAASGFRDTSRLAASDTTMMRDVLLTNRDHLVDALRVYARHLNTLADAIVARDETTLNVILERAATQRRRMFK